MAVLDPTLPDTRSAGEYPLGDNSFRIDVPKEIFTAVHGIV